MAGLPDKRGRDPKFKEAFTFGFWQPLSLQNLLPFIGAFEDVQVQVGAGVGGSELIRESPSSGPSEPRAGLDSIFLIMIPVCFSLPHLRRRLCVCACIRLDMLSLSLSLSLSRVPLDISLYISLFSACLPSNVSAKKKRHVQS
jgi:hypothetical protein